jgi:hypothetical protein
MSKMVAEVLITADPVYSEGVEENDGGKPKEAARLKLQQYGTPKDVDVLLNYLLQTVYMCVCRYRTARVEPGQA